MLVSLNVTNEIEIITSSNGCTLIFHKSYKYLKSGESKTTIQYRCSGFVKRCKSRLIYNKENKSVRKNEIAHNHDADQKAYKQFLKTSSVIQRFSD